MAKKPTKPDIEIPISPPVSDIAVVACLFNPCKYEALNANARAMEDHANALGITVHFEHCFFATREELNGSIVMGLSNSHISTSILWQKEALLNAAVSKLPPEITKVIVIDADILIPSAEWVQEVSAALDKHPIVQPWKRAVVLGPDGSEARCVSSVAYGHSLGDRRASNHLCYHPGYCWAMRRTFWTEGPGLYEKCPVGGGDQFLACAAIDRMPPGPMLPPSSTWDNWAWKVSRWLSIDGMGLGFVDATITTLYHGAPENRNYLSRYKLLNQFDPSTDFAPKTEPGPLEWSEYAITHKWPMIQAIAAYFGARLEDGPVVDHESPNLINNEICASPVIDKDDPSWIFGDSVEQRNARQASGRVFPVLCGTEECRSPLTAVEEGWECGKCGEKVDMKLKRQP